MFIDFLITIGLVAFLAVASYIAIKPLCDHEPKLNKKTKPKK